MSKLRDKTPNIHSTALSMRIPTNNPKTVFNENNSIGHLNDHDSAIDGNGIRKFESTEINMGNNSITPNNEHAAELDNKR